MSESFKLDDIATLLETLSKFEVSEFKLEKGGERLWLKRGKVQSAPAEVVYQQVPSGSPWIPAPTTSSLSNVSASVPVTSTEARISDSVSPIAAAAPENRNVNLLEVKSPMVGTFYRRPAVDAEPYVKVGDQVRKGDVLCIVEAMKLMNEIEAEQSGRIAEICLEDGQMVEYGEVLFRIDSHI